MANSPQAPGATAKSRETILATATGGMAIALASVLSLIKLFDMPQGGSVTVASMLPILFCALTFGPVWGLGIAAVYGVLQFVISPYAAHWASIFLDYPLAFGLLGLAGFFAAPASRRLDERNVLRRLSMVKPANIVIGVIVGMLGRTVSHVLSGVIFYASYAEGTGLNPWMYSLVYNGSYMLPEAIITLVVLLPLAFAFRRPVQPHRA
ncbi:MAG: energy-coupled thiamine transporter ThiT [Saccharofermentanales bacterium]|jgi:thiamine transporter